MGTSSLKRARGYEISRKRNKKKEEYIMDGIFYLFTFFSEQIEEPTLS